MDHSYFLMDSLVTHFLQDNAALLWDPNRPPIAISMATRLVSPSEQSPGFSPSPINQAQADAEAAFVGDNIRQPSLHTLPPLHPDLSSTTTRSLQHPPSMTTTASTAPTAPTAPTAQNPNFSTPPRHRLNYSTASSNFWHSQRLGLWPTDDDSLLNLPDPLSTSQRGEANINDPYLAALVDGEFSSPSSYPSFADHAIHLIQAQSQGPVRPPPVPQASRPQPSAPCPSTTRAPRDPSGACIVNLNFAAPERSTTQLSSSTNAGESQSTLHTLDSFDESDLYDTPSSSFSENMTPRQRQLRTVDHPPDPVHVSKRRRTSVNASPDTHSKSPLSRRKNQSPTSKDIDSLFGSPPSQVTPSAEAHPDDLPTIDLTEANEVPEELRKPVEDKRTKLSAFQCVICMDDVTALTVTHCGHLYCAQCLHSSLHVEATKGKCPMCRQKLDMKPRESYNTKTKGFWPLELKLMTATRKGKRKANTLS